MRLIIYTFFALFFLVTCSDTGDKWNDDIKLFRKLNKLVLNKKESIKWKTPIDSFLVKIPEGKNIVNELKSKYDLSEIQVHELKNSQVGVAYKLGNESNKPYKFLLYTSSVESKGEFESYEQFVECAHKERLRAKWTIVTITDCTD